MMQLHKDNQQPNGKSIVVNLNNEMRNIGNRSYDLHEQNNDHQCQFYHGKVFNLCRGLNTHHRTCYVGSIADINVFLLAEGDEVNLEMEEILEESNIRSEYLPKGSIKQAVKPPRSIQEWVLFRWVLLKVISNLPSISHQISRT